MSKIFRAASALSLAITTVVALSVTDVSFALEASDETPETEIFVDPALLEEDESDQTIIFGEQQEVVAEIPQDVIESDKIANEDTDRGFGADVDFVNYDALTLRELVRQQSRFPDSICGVVYQRSQFSFVRGGKMPRIHTGRQSWRNAVAIAKIAVNDGWESSVEGALFFHARYVSPGWRLKRLATIDNHVFYQ